VLTYALVTPARDEAENLHRLADCIMGQTVAPLAWVVVDDGSTDGTRAYIEGLARTHSWIRLMSSPGAKTHADSPRVGRRVGRDVVAFNAGVAALKEPPDVLLKLDADVSFEAGFFERLLAEFEDDGTLGIAGGECYEFDGADWKLQSVTGTHVRGATRAYRWACWQAVQPLEERLGWDGIDELKAEECGWRVASIPGLRFLHHRPLGQRDGLALAKWARMGQASYFMGYRFPYLVLRTLHRGRREWQALGMICGYLAAAMRRESRHPDNAIRERLREKQALRNLPLRVQETRAAGRGESQSRSDAS